MQYFLFLFAIPFIYLNYKMIVSDMKVKKVPNKYLGYLLLMMPFWFVFMFLLIPSLNYLSFMWEMILTLIMSFVLYYFWIWAAGDAKYLLVLSLFIPHIWVVSLMWNIALLTLVYLFWFFIYFYMWKMLFHHSYSKSFFLNIKEELSTKWEIYKTNKWWKTFLMIFKLIFWFLMMFVSLSLISLYVFNNLFTSNGIDSMEFIQKLLDKYNFYLVFLFMILSVGMMYLMKFTMNKFKNYMSTKFNFNYHLLWEIMIGILFVWLITFIVYQYMMSPDEIKSLLFKMFTLYLILFIFFSILIYSYKLTFLMSETTFMDIKELKEWDMVDKMTLMKMFWTQRSLWAYSEESEPKESEKCLLYPNPKQYFQDLENPMSKEDLNTLKKVFKINNSYHKKELKEAYTDNTSIKMLKTFSFSPYMLLWFIVTFYYSDGIISYILKLAYDTLMNYKSN